MPGTQDASGAGSTPGVTATGLPAAIKVINRSSTYVLTGLNVNAAATDIGTFTGLPTKYRVIRCALFDASASLTLATVDLRTAAGGAGTALVAAFAAIALTASTKFVDATLAAIATTDYQNNSSLVLRCVTAQGAAATISAMLEIEDLS